MSKYNIEYEIKELLNNSTAVVRDLAVALNESPMTTSHRLNGYLQLSDTQRETILSVIKAHTKQDCEPTNPGFS